MRKIAKLEDLREGDKLINTNHNFEIQIISVGKKNVRYLNLETGEKVKSFTSKFSFMLRERVFMIEVEDESSAIPATDMKATKSYRLSDRRVALTVTLPAPLDNMRAGFIYRTVDAPISFTFDEDSECVVRASNNRLFVLLAHEFCVVN